MERKIYGLVVGAIVAAGALGAMQLNAALGQAGGGVVPPNATDTGGDPAAAGNFTITEEGLGNGTAPASIPVPVDTTQLKMHIDAANAAMQANDTQAATQHIVLALEEVEMILGGDVTSTANATGNTTTSGMTNSTQMP